MSENVKYPAKILAALHAVMGAVGYVQKKGRNDFQKYNYAGEGNLLEVLRPAMVENGLLLIPSHRDVQPIDANGITIACVEYTLAHKDGDVWPEKIVVYGAGGDKNSKGVGDKGLYKALTGANKYLLFKLFQIETGDDPEKDSDHDKTGNDAQEEAPKERQLTKAQARPEYDRLLKEMQQQQTIPDLSAWGSRTKPILDAMPPDWQESLKMEYGDHKRALAQKGMQ